MKFCIEMYFTLMNKANLRYLFTILAGERTQYFNPSCSAHWSHSHINIFTLLMTIRNIFIHNRLWEVEGPRCTATVYVPSLIIKYLIWVWSLIEFPWTLWVPLFRVSWDIVRQFRQSSADYQPISQTPNITERLKLLLSFSSARTNRIQTSRYWRTGGETRPALLATWQIWVMITDANLSQDTPV